MTTWEKLSVSKPRVKGKKYEVLINMNGKHIEDTLTWTTKAMWDNEKVEYWREQPWQHNKQYKSLSSTTSGAGLTRWWRWILVLWSRETPKPAFFKTADNNRQVGIKCTDPSLDDKLSIDA